MPVRVLRRAAKFSTHEGKLWIAAAAGNPYPWQTSALPGLRSAIRGLSGDISSRDRLKPVRSDACHIAGTESCLSL